MAPVTHEAKNRLSTTEKQKVGAYDMHTLTSLDKMQAALGVYCKEKVP